MRMDLDTIHALFRYNRWANGRVLAAAALVPHADFVRDVGDTQGSLRDLLTHIAWSEWIWVQRWTGVTRLVFQPADFPHVPPALVFQASEFPDVASLSVRWAAIEDECAAFVAALTPGRLSEEIEYMTVTGDSWRRPLGRQLIHAVTHSTYHRGQVARLLRRLGHVPPGTDFITLDE